MSAVQLEGLFGHVAKQAMQTVSRAVRKTEGGRHFLAVRRSSFWPRVAPVLEFSLWVDAFSRV